MFAIYDLSDQWSYQTSYCVKFISDLLFELIIPFLYAGPLGNYIIFSLIKH